MLPCFAQRDIKTLVYLGEDGIIKVLGKPAEVDGWEDRTILVYSDGTVIHINDETGVMEGFGTHSPKFCMLSNYVRGGFKVGDPFSKVQAFDFVHSKYGRNRPGNALKFVDSNVYRDLYVAYENERIQFEFSVKDGVITVIGMRSISEEFAEDYDKDNLPW